MTILLLAKADLDDRGHEPVWGLQGGNRTEIKDKILKVLKDAAQNELEDTLVGWCELAEAIATQVDPRSNWSASHVYFFSIPDGVEYEIKRDTFGNEVAIYFQGGNSLENVRFAEEIQLSDISNF